MERQGTKPLNVEARTFIDIRNAWGSLLDLWHGKHDMPQNPSLSVQDPVLQTKPEPFKNLSPKPGSFCGIRGARCSELSRESLWVGTWRFGGSYKWSYKSGSYNYNPYSVTYNPTYNYP